MLSFTRKIPRCPSSIRLLFINNKGLLFMYGNGFLKAVGSKILFFTRFFKAVFLKIYCRESFFSKIFRPYTLSYAKLLIFLQSSTFLVDISITFNAMFNCLEIIHNSITLVSFWSFHTKIFQQQYCGLPRICNVNCFVII